MSLAWGSKFLEYSATADRVNTSPLSLSPEVGRPFSLVKCSVFAYSIRSFSVPGDCYVFQIKLETIRKRRKDSWRPTVDSPGEQRTLGKNNPSLLTA